MTPGPTLRRRPSNEELVAQWHSELTFDQVCRALDVEPGRLRAWWRDLRKTGRLPMEGRRSDLRDEVAIKGEDEHEPRITTGKHSDPLLDQLRRFHGSPAPEPDGEQGAS